MTHEHPRPIPGKPLVWILLGIATVLRFYHLGHQSIWVDEYTSFLCAIPYGRMTFHDLWENLHGPLHALSVHVLAQWMGATTVTLRLPTAIAGIATVGVMYRVGERMLGRGGAISAALATFSPFLIWYSQEARNYAFVILFAATATWAWVELLQTRRWPWWVVYVVACVAGVLSNLSMLFVIAAHAVHWLYLAWRERKSFRAVQAWVVYAVLVFAVVSPWLWNLYRAFDWTILVRHVQTPEPLRREVGMTWLAVPYAFYSFALGFSMGPSPRELHGAHTLPLFLRHLWWMIPAGAFFGGLTLAGLRALRGRRRALSLLLCWLLVPLVLTLWITARNVKVFNPRYVAVALPALYLIWTAGLVRAPRWARWGSAALFAAFWGVALYNHYANPAYNKDDVRGAGAYVATHWYPGDYLVTAGAARPVLFYMNRNVPTSQFWLGFTADTVHLAANFNRFVPRTASRIWVVSGRPRWYDPQDRFRRFLLRRQVLEQREFLGCSVFLLRGPGPARPPAWPPGDSTAWMPGAPPLEHTEELP